tara:strand:+ start:537 stop:743 length:207 start_codon:yes stop_codon:yes gene_type:complete
MATILERRKKIEKEQRRFVRKLNALQEECDHLDHRNHPQCMDCLKMIYPPDLPDLDPFADSEMAGGVQ